MDSYSPRAEHTRIEPTFIESPTRRGIAESGIGQQHSGRIESRGTTIGTDNSTLLHNDIEKAGREDIVVKIGMIGDAQVTALRSF